MAATDLTALRPPPGCTDWALAADPHTWVDGHAVTVNLTWWNTSLTERGLGGGPVLGRTRTGEITQTGRAAITRGDLFTLADPAPGTPDDALRLLWHTLAWGAGNKVRLVHKRMDAVAADPTAAVALQSAAEKSRTDPRAAYETLNSHGSPRIPHLGAAFFTKYLYAAGAGRAAHPCLILDSRVAAALHRAGWNSLGTGGRWPAHTYERYCRLLTRWADESGIRPDLIERWLFDAGAPRSPA